MPTCHQLQCSLSASETLWLGLSTPRESWHGLVVKCVLGGLFTLVQHAFIHVMASFKVVTTTRCLNVLQGLSAWRENIATA